MKRLVLIAVTVFAQHALAQVGVRDDYGRVVELAAPAARIVSLAPHLTELLYSAGAGAKVVGAIAYSDYPPAARALPRVGSDAGIDLEAVLALRPDLVVAWPNPGSVRAIDRLAALGIAVYRSEPRSFDDIARTLERLGALAGTSAAAGAAARAFRARLARLEAKYSGRAPVRVFYEVWGRPIVTVNGAHLISKVIRLCGGRNVFARLPLIAPEVDREAVLRADPQVIVASGADGERPAWLDAWKAFPGLAAARDAQLYTIPPDLIERQSTRILDGAARMCRTLDAVRAGAR
jgi:iron complex transport system substrate-binding protein